jgi:hypothetical protein
MPVLHLLYNFCHLFTCEWLCDDHFLNQLPAQCYHLCLTWKMHLSVTNKRCLTYSSWLQVLDYKTQQSRLFPLLASAYAFRFVGDWLKWLYMDVTQKLEAKDYSTLQEAHACTAGLKAVTTSATAVSIIN